MRRGRHGPRRRGHRRARAGRARIDQAAAARGPGPSPAGCPRAAVRRSVREARAPSREARARRAAAADGSGARHRFAAARLGGELERRGRATRCSSRAVPARSGSAGVRSVASSAASVSLSTRNARASGARRQRCTSSRGAGEDPGLRTAEQLVAAGGHQARAAPQRCRDSPARRAASGSGCSRPLPTSTTTGGPRPRELGDVHVRR